MAQGIMKAPYETEQVTITIDTTKVASGSITCYKRSGWCYVSGYNIVLKAAGEGQEIASGFPQTLAQPVVTPTGSGSSMSVSNDAVYLPNGTSKLRMHASSTTYNKGHWFSFAYPYVL